MFNNYESKIVETAIRDYTCKQLSCRDVTLKLVQEACIALTLTL